MSDRSSPTPPSPPTNSLAESTGRHSAIPEPDGTIALRRVNRLAAVVGEPPNPLTREPGTGLHAVLERLVEQLDGIAEELAALRASRAAWEMRVSRLAWLVVGAVVVLAVGSLWALLAHVRLT